MISLTDLEASHIVLTLSSVLELVNDGVSEDITYLAEDIENSIEILKESGSQENDFYLEEGEGWNDE